MPRRLVHVVVRVYPHLVLDVADVLQRLTGRLLDALERTTALDVREREAKLLHIVAVVGRKGQVAALPVVELDRRVERAAQFELIPLKLLNGPQGRVGQLDEDEFLVVAGAGAAGVLLGQSIVASAQGGHLEARTHTRWTTTDLRQPTGSSDLTSPEGGETWRYHTLARVANLLAQRTGSGLETRFRW